MFQKVLKFLGPLAGLAIFAAAVFILHHQLHEYHYRDIRHALHSLPAGAVFLAVFFTLLNYIVLSLYELLGFRYIGNRLSPLRVMFTSFISYAFSNNVGFYTVSGSAVRFRLYSQFGLSATEITRLIVFVNGIAFWLGLCAVGSLMFLAVPPPDIPSSLPVSGQMVRVVGVVFLLLVLGAVLFSIFRKQPLRVRQWEFDIPHPLLLGGLIVAACCDWMLCGAALYVLLPHGNMGYLMFMGLFLASMIAGLASHVPGGLGVFETGMLLLLPHENHAAIFSALIAFRGIYYLAPLGIASVLLGGHEIMHRKDHFADALQAVGRWGAGAIPYLFAVMIFAGGMILLLSGATPAEHYRWHILVKALPLPMLEVSHFMGSLFGIALVMLAWGLYRRLDGAYHMVLWLLLGGAVFSLLKGLDWEEASIMAAMALILLPCRKVFYRKTSLIHDRFSPGWLFMVAIALVSTLWLGLFTYKHVEYSSELWWRFGVHDNAPRFMRAIVGCMVAAFSFSLVQFFSPVRAAGVTTKLTDDVSEHVVRILQQSAATTGWLALLGDKQLLFDESGNAYLMYGVEGRSWIVMGDPVGDAACFPSLVWRFREECDRHNGRPVFYEVSQRYLPLYLDLGLVLLKIGEEGKVSLRDFSVEGGTRKSMRHTISRLEREGCSFEIVAGNRVDSLLGELKEVSDDWLDKKNVREKHFSLGYFNEAYLRHTPFALVKQGDRIAAFTNIWVSGDHEELSVDLMRYHETAPKSVVEYLFINMMLWGSREGYSWFNLGMAPLSGLEDRSLAPLWHRIGSLLYHHGDTFYNFQGLREYKDKFRPIWEPRYLAVPPGLGVPLVLRDLVSIVSGGITGVVLR